MNDDNLEKFIFFRFVNISYIVLISLFLIWMIKITFIMLENKEVVYSESKVECYNGKQIKLCCDPFLHVKLNDYKLDEKSDFLVRRMCHEGSDPVSEKNYELNLKYEYPKTGLFVYTLTLLVDLIMFFFVYISLNIIRELLLYAVYAKPIYWRWLWKLRIFS
jgi:hypothetical protein